MPRRDPAAGRRTRAAAPEPEPEKSAARPRRASRAKQADPEPTEGVQDGDFDSTADAEAASGPTEDWTQPDYANDPGIEDDDFDSLADADEHLSLMWFGPEGTGKTTNLARMLELGPGKLLLVNAEGGVKRRALERHGIDPSRVVLYPKQGQRPTFEGLERLYYRLAHDLEQNVDSWVGVGWDSATAIQAAMHDTIVEADIRQQQEILQRAGRGRKGRSGNITVRGRFENDRDDYSTLAQQFRLLLRKYRTLPCHFGVTALLRRDEDKKTSAVNYGPAVSPALQTELMGYVDIAIRTYVTEGDDGPVFWGRTAPTETDRGKDRYGVLPYQFVDPTADRIQDYLDQELSEETDEVQDKLPADVRVARGRSVPGPDDDEPDEEPESKPAPKRQPRRGSGASSGRTRASARETAPESEPEPPDSEPEPEAKKPARPARRSRRTDTEAKARAEVKADTDDKPPRRRRTPKSPPVESGGNPPF